MQQNHQDRYFENTAQQQPVYRFPQNQPARGWQPQQSFNHEDQQPVEEDNPPKRQRRSEKKEKKKRRRVFTWWNLFAVIGMVTVLVQLARYVVIPLLVYLNVLAGGTL